MAASPYFALGALALLAGAGAAAAVTGGGSKVRFRERAEGVHPDLQWLLDEWEREGTHVIVIAGGDGWPAAGGLRAGAAGELGQAAALAMGLSNAGDLSRTPHGRGAALDVWPDGFNPHRGYGDPDQLPNARELMRAFGAFAKQRGFVWGGDFRSGADDPHVEIFNWRSLPYPPPDYRGVNHA